MVLDLNAINVNLSKDFSDFILELRLKTVSWGVCKFDS